MYRVDVVRTGDHYQQYTGHSLMVALRLMVEEMKGASTVSVRVVDNSNHVVLHAVRDGEDWRHA